MAEQFPEKGGKIPASKTPSRRGLSGHSPAWAPEMQKEHGPSPLPPPTGQEEFGALAFPPKARRTFPWHPYSHQSLLSSFRYPCLPSSPFLGLIALQKPPPSAAAPGFTCPPGTPSVHSCHGRCHPLPRAHNLGRKLPGTQGCL